ncbi:MAG: Phytochrome-like protein cph2 [Acidimicrobiales bacterium]|nr:Phytochrome-like protein cph2 [Acidimicrobiales bacterium]
MNSVSRLAWVTRSQSGPRLFLTFAALSLVPVLGLGVVLNQMVRREIDDRALAEAVSRAQTIADGSMVPALDGRNLAAGISADERARLVRATRSLHGDATVLRLRLRSNSGAIVFDADHPAAPLKPFTDAEVEEAASGKVVRALTRINADSIDGRSHQGVRAVETYVALHGPNNARVVGVLEIYLPYAPFRAAAAASKHRLSWLMGGGLLAIWSVLAFTSWSATRRVRRSARENDWLAHHDRLTGLPNRLAFNEEIERRWKGQPKLLIAVIDIVRFREVNETLGHANGDQFLCLMTEALQRADIGAAVLARLGGDLFAVLVDGDDRQVDQRLLSGIRQAIAAGFDVGGIHLHPELTIGVASTLDGVSSAAELLRAADLSVHAAKELGEPVVRYSPAFDHFDPARLELANELGPAIAAGELVLHYQPKIDLATGAVRSLEALVRWDHPRRGRLAPDEFIPIAESTSLIGPLTEWVLGEACRQIAIWAETGISLPVSVNISARSLADLSLPADLLGALALAGISPSLLEVEVTETAVVADIPRAQHLLAELHRAGVRVSLDDFGQGATSLLSLTDLPLDEIKIDRSFVTDMDHNAERRAVVSFVVSLAHRLGLTVVAEGVETADASALLTEMGCDQAQGFLYSRPLAAADLVVWLRDHAGSRDRVADHAV